VTGRNFSAEDERLMTAFASSAATAVPTARDVAAQGLRRSLEAAAIAAAGRESSTTRRCRISRD
jgi:hypothetical protein